MLALARAVGLVLALALEPPSVPLLRNPRFHDPMVGGVLGGYAGDTGLDLGGVKLPVLS